MRQSILPAVALIALLGLTACGSEPEAATDSSAAATASLLDQAEDVRAQQPTVDIASLGFNHGADDAPVRVLELSDFGCGFCRKFHEETFPALFEEFIESGKIQWKFLPFITGMFDNSPVATMGAECALEQSAELFVALGDRLWAEQSAWKGASDPAPVVRGMALEAGVEAEQWDSCMAENRQIDRIRYATTLANQLGVRGTPTFFVVGYPPLQGALPTETFQEILTAVYDDAVSREDQGGG